MRYTPIVETHLFECIPFNPKIMVSKPVIIGNSINRVTWLSIRYEIKATIRLNRSRRVIKNVSDVCTLSLIIKTERS